MSTGWRIGGCDVMNRSVIIKLTPFEYAMLIEELLACSAISRGPTTHDPKASFAFYKMLALQGGAVEGENEGRESGSEK